MPSLPSSVGRLTQLGWARGAPCGDRCSSASLRRRRSEPSTRGGEMNARTRIYWRERGGAKGAYADLRDYADGGGGRGAPRPPGGELGTADADTTPLLPRRAAAGPDPGRS